jgi:DNA-binding PadR family transcriptional regulator
MVDKAEIESNLPLSESTFLILLSLAGGPRHGYGILKDVAALSQDRVQLSTGTLYGALKRMLAQDWIELAGADLPPGLDAVGPGRPRRYYVLTGLGRGLLEAELARLRSLLAAARLHAREVQP